MRVALIASAILFVVPGSASAQSVLERVLGQIDGATNIGPVNGLYANIAESVRGAFTTTALVATDYEPVGSEVLYNVFVTNDYFGVSSPANPVLFLTVTYDMLGTSGAAPIGVVPFSYVVAADGRITITSNPSNPGAGFVVSRPDAFFRLEDFWVGGYGGVNNSATAYGNGAEFYTNGTGGYYYLLPAVATALSVTPAPGGTRTQTTRVEISQMIDGSITNVIMGARVATTEAVAGALTARQIMVPTIDLGALSTTTLGAVNTGAIALGTNLAMDEVNTTATQAISAVLTQVGGSADTGALMLNMAHNTSGVNGSITGVMTGVRGTIGAASTTVLGAVNTGTITSGVNAAVVGITGDTGQFKAGL